MDAVALILVLVAALLSASWNRILHDAGDKLAVMGVSGLMTGALLLPATLAQPPWRVWGLILISALAETVYSVTLSAAYQRGDLSLTYPLGRGAAPLLVTLGGAFVLAEPPRAGPLCGAVLLGAGLVLLTHAGWRAGKLEAVGFALLAGLTIAIYTVVDAGAVRQVSPAGYLGPVLALQGAAVCAGLRWDAARLRRSLLPSFLVALASLSAYLIILLALRRAEAGRVATIREIAVLFGVLMARERAGPWIWAGAALCVAGAMLAAV